MKNNSPLKKLLDFFWSKTESKTEVWTESKTVLDRIQNRVKDKAIIRKFSQRYFFFLH